MLRYLTTGLLTFAALLGCSQPAQPTQRLDSESKTEVEDDFATQVANVRQQRADRIQIESQPISDEQIKSLAGLDHLAVLQLDYATNSISSDGFAVLAKLPELMHLRLRGTHIDDESAKELSNSASLQILNIPQSELTDAGLADLAKLENLVQLRIGSSKLTDSGLENLKRFPKLKRVHLIDVPITDAGLAVFHDMPKLESLYIDGAKPSDAAYDKLFKAQPKLHVHVDQAHHDRDPHDHPH